VRALGEQRDYHGAAVSTDDGDGRLVGVHACDGGGEARGVDDVESGDAEHAFGVVCTGLGERRCDDGYGGVDGVGDGEDVCCEGDTADRAGEVADDGCVGL
jgi:hypothetical protein